VPLIAFWGLINQLDNISSTGRRPSLACAAAASSASDPTLAALPPQESVCALSRAHVELLFASAMTMNAVSAMTMNAVSAMTIIDVFAVT
jgi:hypothetical protein